MNNLNRQEFLKLTSAAAMFTLAGKLGALAQTNTPAFPGIDSALMQKLNAANDDQVKKLMESVRPGNLVFGRKTAYDFSNLTAAYCSPGSVYHHDAAIIIKLELLLDFLAAAQTADGTVNIGNLESPPDTAFLVEILGAAAAVLKEEKDPALQKTEAQLKAILVKAGDALAVGGVHTPNHRWVISAALAQLYVLYPDKKYKTRIDDWLSEGVYNDADGNYPERSGTYSYVENTAMISMARFLNRPQLLVPVRKNLNLFYYHIEPDGELVSVESRRQDQYVPRNSNVFYLQYRYMAIRDKNPFWGAIAKQMETQKDFKEWVLDKGLFYFLENKMLQETMPLQLSLPDYEKLIATSDLLRVRKNNTTLTYFGGIDWPLIIASGRSCSPNFFSYRKGDAILKYLRLSSAFFSTGYFYSEGLKKKDGSYVLHKKLTVPYYQPLPLNKRNKNGDYKLSPSIDDRFWNKMDFSNRPVSNVKTLDTTITLTVQDGQAALKFEIKGMENVLVTIELCFKEGGILDGVTTGEKGNSFLENGTGEFRSGNDVIHFGPGSHAHKQISDLEGERYSTHFGTLRTEGTHVYITGKTPFVHTLYFS
jgi:hypothetical protein